MRKLSLFKNGFLRSKRAFIRRASGLTMAAFLMASTALIPLEGLVYVKADTTNETASIIAFPGAEGGGMYASGGRGYDVYVVTNLEDYGVNETPIEGSLRYGIENSTDGCIIVFNVGGTINLKQTLSFRDKKNITIAGQTAPGDGITLSGYETNISNSENLIIRFVRFRTGSENVYTAGDSMDALWGRDNKTFIIDHCSFSWNTDETLSTYRGADGTVQWCIISESLTVSGHSKGRHGYGGIFGGDNCVFQYNLIANHTSRNPRLGGGTMTDPTKVYSMATVQLSNNYLYNWGYYSCYGGGYTLTNYINNYFKTGPGTRDAAANTILNFGEKTKPGGVYYTGNVFEGNDSVTADNSKGFKLEGVTTGDTATVVSDTPYESDAFNQITLRSATDSSSLVLNQAGCTYPERDAIDARVVADVENGTGYYINTQDEVGGYCTEEATRDASFDSDLDGIPDYWETAHGLDPNDASDSAKISDSGYANVELYFNSLVEGVTDINYVAPNPTVSIDLANNTQVDEGKPVTVTANATANNGGSISKVEFYNGDKLVATDTEAPYSYTFSNLEDGTYSISVRAYDNEDNETQSDASKLHVNSLASSGDWLDAEVGNPALSGGSSLENGVLTVKGNGKVGREEGSVKGTENYDAADDDFHYTYQQVTGDAELVVKLDEETVVDCHTFTGLMFRESLADDAKQVALGFSMVKLSSATCWATHMSARKTTGGATSELSETLDSASNAESAGIGYVTDLNYKTGGIVNGTWLKLVRKGDTFTGYASDDGENWTLVSEMEVDLPDTAYIGFAVDSGQVANDINNLVTAKFSNINLNLDLTEETEPTTGEDTPSETEKSESENKYAPTVVDENNLLTKTASGSTMILKQSATKGNLAISGTTEDSNASYILFPETTKNGKLEMDITIDGYSIFGNEGKRSGVFVGVFGSTLSSFTTLGLRGYDANTGSDSISGYWTKSTGSAGNGSPKYNVAVGDTYHVVVERTSAGYTLTFTDLTNPLEVTATGSTYSGSKTIKLSDLYTGEGNVGPNSAVRFGIALVGANVSVKNMVYYDASGNVLYNQADYYKDAGTAPTITKVNTPVVNEDRTAITVSYEGEGLTGDGKYEISVSSDGGHTYKTLGTTTETSYSYSPSASGSYIFKVTGVMGETVSNTMESEAVSYKKPLTSPTKLTASSGNAKNSLSWASVSGATGYRVYRKSVDEEEYTLLGTTSSTSYEDTSAVNETVYNYAVLAYDSENESNLSSAVTIMATAGHTGEYYFGDEAASLTVSAKSNDTITDSSKASFTIAADEAGSWEIKLNGDLTDTKTTAANQAITEEISLADGRNEVVAYFTSESGVKTYKTFNFVKLTNIDIVVDASYTGVAGAEVDGVPTFATVGEAIESVDANNSERVVIYLKNGRYYEKLTVNTSYITLIGEDSLKTVLYYDVASGSLDASGKTYGTSGSASLTLNGGASHFTAENMTISNEFDYPNENIDGKQAVALLNNADETTFTNVRFLGYQDTLYANGSSNAGRQYYNRCYIEGNVDFIFGRAIAAFYDCEIVSNGDGYLTAASTEGKNTVGYVFINCHILAKSGVKGVYLARPWGSNASVAYINCYLDSKIRENGYCDMSNNSYKNARFSEYGSYGAGFKVNTDRIQLSALQASKIDTVAEVLAADANQYSDGAWDAEAEYAAISASYVAAATEDPETPENPGTPEDPETPEEPTTPETPEEISYEMLSGDTITIVPGEEVVLRSAATVDKFVAVLVDGEEIDSSYYTITSGSTIATISGDYTATLAEGEHSIAIKSTDGSAVAKALVAAKPAEGETGSSEGETGAGEEPAVEPEEPVVEPTEPATENTGDVAADEESVARDSAVEAEIEKIAAYEKEVDRLIAEQNAMQIANSEVSTQSTQTGDFVDALFYAIVMIIAVFASILMILFGESTKKKEN